VLPFGSSSCSAACCSTLGLFNGGGGVVEDGKSTFSIPCLALPFSIAKIRFTRNFPLKSSS
jgi:hypothetical protein